MVGIIKSKNIELHHHHPFRPGSEKSSPNLVKAIVDKISSVVLRGVSHEGRLIDSDACNREQEGKV